MNKLKLDLDTVEVESFEVAVADTGRGTVHGQNSNAGWASYCGPCTWDYPEGDPPVVESMMEYATCGGGFSCWAEGC
ncbi:MAG TPA: hypothetical protein VFE05_04480 [Longimicrobiaceae bacterium]|jgi:hypothetical protein|nr:hypothetical protein [Longimicrobiaceae bacterium]